MLDSDDPVTADLLAGLLEVLADTGGWLHPGARLVAREGRLSVHANARPGEPLLRVPREALVRIGRVEWAVPDGVLIPSAFSDELDGPELEALFLLSGLLNQCGKLPDLVRTHPLLATDLSPDVVAAARAFRASFGHAAPDAVSLLWSTRCFRVGFDGGPPEPVAVPILELMNHHTGGASATPTDGGFAVDARVHDGDECFLDYGRDRDAISMAIVYGFADASARIAHSVPVDIEVPGVGRVTVAARGRDRTGELLPMTVSDTADGVAINRITFGVGHAPTHELALATGWHLDRAERVIDAVRGVNLELLEALERAAMTSDAAPAVETLRSAAAIQRRILEQGDDPARAVPTGSAAAAKGSISEDDFDLGQWR